MKIYELKRIAAENDYEYKFDIDHEFTNKNNGNYVTINSVCENSIWTSIRDWCSDEDFNMIKAAVEFAETPPDEREEEKKFWIQHNFMVSKNLLPVNLVWNKIKDAYRSINLKVDNHIYQAQFTFKEYEGIKKKLNTDLKDFELVEVKEWP